MHEYVPSLISTYLCEPNLQAFDCQTVNEIPS